MPHRLIQASIIVGLFVMPLHAQPASWPPGGETPSPITASMRLPGGRFVPSSKRWNLVWADQLIPGNLTSAQIQFAAKHYAATQKIWDYQTAQFRAIHPNFLTIIYHLAAGLNPQRNNDCPDPKSNRGNSFIGVVAPKGYVAEDSNYFWPWCAAQGIAPGSNRYEAMFQHYDVVDSLHRVWHQDPAWLMDLQNADWKQYLGDATLDWMRGTQDDGCFFDVAVETNSSLYNPKSGDPTPANFDWWAPPHGPANEALQTTTRAAFASWMNRRYLACYQDIHRRFHTPDSTEYLVIPNTDQMVTTVYDPTWTDGDSLGETIDGAMMENFGSYRGQDMWLTLDRGVRHITGRGKILIAQFGAADSAERMRRVAMYMLIKNENSFLNILNVGGVEWYPEYEIDLGDQSPLPRTLDSLRLGGRDWLSVWARDYARGRVLVNTSDAAIAIAVPSIGQWGRVVTSGGGQIAGDGTSPAGSMAVVPVSGVMAIGPSEGIILKRLDSVSSVRTIDAPRVQSIDVVPNPTSDRADALFSFAQETSAAIRVRDALGRTVEFIPSKEWSEGEHRVTIESLGSLGNGVYVVEVVSAAGSKMTRFLVLH